MAGGPWCVIHPSKLRDVIVPTFAWVWSAWRGRSLGEQRPAGPVLPPLVPPAHELLPGHPRSLPPLFRFQPRATLGSSSGLVASALMWLPLPELMGRVCSDTQRHQDWVPSDRDVLCPELGRELGSWLFPSDCRRTVGRMKEPQTSR